jgi:hypothetical protein
MPSFHNNDNSTSSSISETPGMEVRTTATPQDSRPASKMSSRSDSLSANVDIPNLPKDTPPEMIPILTLLHAHQSRDYFDGYFMLLNDLNTGKSSPLFSPINRRAVCWGRFSDPWTGFAEILWPTSIKSTLL